MRIIFSGIFLFFFFLSCNQKTTEKSLKAEYIVSISFSNFPNKTVYLADFYGDKNNIIDSAKTDSKGKLEFIFAIKKRPIGMYRILVYDNIYFDFLFDNEDISFSTAFPFLADSTKVILSEENNVFFDFEKSEKEYNQKAELLAPLIYYYPKSDPFYSLIEKKFALLQTERKKNIQEIITSFPNTLLCRIIKTQKRPIIDTKLDEQTQKKQFRIHFFDNLDFSDTVLLRTNVFTNKTIKYLTLFTNKQNSREQQQEAFILATDTILRKAFINQKVYEQILDYLMRGFEEYHFEKVLKHISSNYSIETSCENKARKTTLQKRLENYNNLGVGHAAPEINMKDLNGKNVLLSQTSSDYFLVVFWASWCPYCKELMPEINKIQKQNKNKMLKIIAISIDTSIVAWKNEIKKDHLIGTQSCDGKGWGSKPVDDYAIYATPTMYLLNSKKIILSKPTSANELYLSLKKEKIIL